MHEFTCKVVLCKGLRFIDKKTNSLHGTNRAIARGRHTRRLLAILPLFKLYALEHNYYANYFSG